MRKDIIESYKTFDINNKDEFFNALVDIIAKHKTVFAKYITPSFFEEILKYRSEDFILGHSDDFFAEEIQNYLNDINHNDEERIVRQIVGLVASLSSYMLFEETCPVCEQSNMRLLSDYQNDQVYEFCEECLYITLDKKSIRSGKELYPAKKVEVLNYLKKIEG